MVAKLDGTNGLLQQYDYQVLTTGFSYTFAAGTTVLVINPAGTLATGTITFPAAPVDGMTVTFSSTQQITALTLSGNGKTIVSAVTLLPANQATAYVYRLSNTSWYPMTNVATNTLTSPTITSPTINGTPVMGASVITSGTAVASTSGTSIDFTGLPSWVKRITVMFNSVSTTGTSSIQVQLGTGSTTFATSGYLGGSMNTTASAIGTANFTSGLVCSCVSAAAGLIVGHVVFTNVSGNIWTGSLNCSRTDAAALSTGATVITLGAVLTGVRITTINGTDTFDAGSINILYE